MTTKRILFLFIALFIKCNLAFAINCFDSFYKENIFQYTHQGKYLLFSTGKLSSIERTLYIWQVGEKKAAHKISGHLAISMGVKIGGEKNTIIYGEVDKLDAEKCAVESSLHAYNTSGNSTSLLISNKVQYAPFFLSNDGKKVIYNAEKKGEPKSNYLFSKKVDLSEEAIQLSNRQWAKPVFISPIDDTLYYYASENLLVGNVNEKIVEPISLIDIDYISFKESGIRLSADGKYFIYSIFDGIFLRSTDGLAEPVKLSNNQGKTTLLAILNKRNEVLIGEQKEENLLRVYAKNYLTLTERELGSFSANKAYVKAIDTKERNALISFDADGQSELYSIDMATNRNPVLINDSRHHDIYSVSKNEEYFLFNTEYEGNYLAKFNGESVPQKVYAAVFSPDSKWLLDRIDEICFTGEFYKKNLAGNDEPIFWHKFNQSISPYSITPDGKFLILGLDDSYGTPGLSNRMFAKRIDSDEAAIPLIFKDDSLRIAAHV